MQIELFSFSKRYNSTKQATTGTGITFSNVNLKDDCSIINPVVLFAVSSMPVPTVAPSIYNYAYISKFQRYYFIDDWVYVGGIWEAHMSVDVLASNKTGIGAVSTMIERSYTSYDGSVVDTFYPIRTTTSISYVTISNYFNTQSSLNTGAFVLGIAGYPSTNTGSLGGVNYFAINSTQLTELARWLFNNNIYSGSNITDISEGLFKATFNPMQYIISCMFFPFAPSEFDNGHGQQDIYMNGYDTGIDGYPVGPFAIEKRINVQIPDHPQISRGSYLNYEPYTKASLYIPPIGCVPVDLSFRSVGSYVRCRLYVDTHTGQADVRFNLCTSSDVNAAADTKLFYQCTCQIGVPVQLTQATLENLNMNNVNILSLPLKALGATVTQVASEAMGSSLSGASYTGGFPTVATNGANGSFLYMMQSPILVVEHYQITEEDRTEFGRPLYQTKTINTLSGYVKCADAHIELPITDAERKKIVSLMNSGFFYE